MEPTPFVIESLSLGPNHVSFAGQKFVFLNLPSSSIVYLTESEVCPLMLFLYKHSSELSKRDIERQLRDAFPPFRGGTQF